MGGLLGWKALPPIVFAASFVGVVVSIPVLLLQRRKQKAPEAQLPSATEADEPVASHSIRRSEVPFGPFLAASAIGYLFLHRQIWTLIEQGLSGG